MKLSNLLILYIYDAEENIKLLEFLNKEFKKVFIAKNLKEAQSNYKKYSPCIIIVDNSFTNRKIVDYLQEIRKIDMKTAFVVLTQNENNPYILELLELYITKYIVKPYREEFLYSSLLKCSDVIESRIYSNVKLKDNIFFNFQTQSLINNGKITILNKKESLLINLFIQNPNRVITYEELEYHIWDEEGTQAALKSLIRDFRKKSYKSILKNYSKIGYKLNLEN
ncbi:response regulator transcription factor [Aliarcobacter trophiarum]|uniref:response regulator transcription factor n=1 Tax=Aliarcobacter trophiarum TaxID=708186 RepID=UPI00100BE279|nr:response regulator [Aliarcobacter trophiarum]RXI26492.1 DNA-binding response regulator [Aliarcobacter trophiarum]